MLEAFEHRSKDIIFLVSVEKSMHPFIESAKADLRQIFDFGLEAEDRISLITFG